MNQKIQEIEKENMKISTKKKRIMRHASSRVVPGRNFGDGQITINQNVNYKTKTT